MRTAADRVCGSAGRRQRGAWGVCWLVVAAALSLAGCANVTVGPPVAPGQGAPPGPTWPSVHGPLAPDGAYNGGGDLCRNFRAYHSDCRRRHDAGGSGNQPQGSGGGQRGAGQPADAASSA